jgi:SAM-dependent methyltransferase
MQNQDLHYYYQTSVAYRDSLLKHDESFLASYIQLVRTYVQPASRVLDLGCGTGFSTLLLRKQQYEAVGVDISHLFLSTVKAEAPEMDLLCADAFSLPFGDHSFDAVAAFEFVEHVPNIPALLNEILRIVKLNGYIIINSPNLLSPYTPGFSLVRMLIGQGGKTAFARTLPEAFQWFVRNLALSLRKRFSTRLDFTYRAPDLSETKHIGGDSDSVYLATQLDLARYLQQYGCKIQQLAYGESMKNKLAVRFTPSFAPLIGLVAKKN